MSTKGKKKLKNFVNNAKNIDDESLISKRSFSITICLKPQDDVPHPRHLCFAHPFGKSSPKKHCIKCYCFVCEKIAPCKRWKKSPKRHCDATEADNKWVLEKELINKRPGSTTMLYHTLTVSATSPVADGPDQALYIFGGGLVCNDDGKWVIGTSRKLCLCSIFNTGDISAPYYIALIETLEVAWLSGFRYLQVKLGFVFHDRFWTDFTRDAASRIFRLRVSNSYNQALGILKAVEDYLNREWFISVKNTESGEEESGAFIVSTQAELEGNVKEIYDFRSHSFDTETMTKEFMNDVREAASSMAEYDALSDERKKYFGLD